MNLNHFIVTYGCRKTVKLLNHYYNILRIPSAVSIAFVLYRTDKAKYTIEELINLKHDLLYRIKIMAA